MPIWPKDFERAIDEFFDDVLISRWRQGSGGRNSNLRDAGDHYEIDLAAPGVDPADLEIEVSGNQLTVRDKRGSLEAVFAVPTQIAAERARARWSDGVLRVVVPKRRRRKIPVDKS